MADFTDKLTYVIDVDQQELDAITSKVSKATASGVSIGSGGSGTGGPGGGSPGGAGGPNFSAFVAAVSAFTSAVTTFTKAVTGMGTGGPGPGGGPTKPPPMPWMNVANQNLKASRLLAQYRQRLSGRGSGLFGHLGANSPAGQAFRSGFGFRGVGGQFISHMIGNMPNMPAVQALHAAARAGTPGAMGALGGMYGQAAMRGVGGAIAGHTGAALAGGGPAGLAALGIIAAIQNISTAFGHLNQAIGTLYQGVVAANASGAMHGMVSAAQGVASLFGGKLAGSVVGLAHTFIDAMDSMVDNLGKYNGATAAALGMYQATQVMFQVQLSQMLEPLMTWWVELKGKVLQGLMDALQKIVPAFKALWEILSIIYKFSGLKIVLDLFIDSVKFMVGMMADYAKVVLELTLALLKILGWLSPLFDAATAKLQKSLTELKDALDGNTASLTNAAKELNAKMTMPQGRGGPVAAPWNDPRKAPGPIGPLGLPGVQGPGGAMPGAMMLASAIGAAAIAALRGNFSSAISRVPTTHFGHPHEIPGSVLFGDPSKAPWSYMGANRALNRKLKQQADDRHFGAAVGEILGGAMAVGGFGGMAGNGAGAGGKPPDPVAVHPPQFPGFSNQFKVPITMQINNDKQMADSLHQIRENLLRAFNISRDETRLLAGMFDAGLAAGM